MDRLDSDFVRKGIILGIGNFKELPDSGSYFISNSYLGREIDNEVSYLSIVVNKDTGEIKSVATMPSSLSFNPLSCILEDRAPFVACERWLSERKISILSKDDGFLLLSKIYALNKFAQEFESHYIPSGFSSHIYHEKDYLNSSTRIGIARLKQPIEFLIDGSKSVKITHISNYGDLFTVVRPSLKGFKLVDLSLDDISDVTNLIKGVGFADDIQSYLKKEGGMPLKRNSKFNDLSF